jgi:hypothetical protein
MAKLWLQIGLTFPVSSRLFRRRRPVVSKVEPWRDLCETLTLKHIRQKKRRPEGRRFDE